MPDDDQTTDGPRLLQDGGGTIASVDAVGDERRRRTDMQLAKRKAVLDDLLTKLDYAVYAQLAALYHMELVFNVTDHNTADFRLVARSYTFSFVELCNSPSSLLKTQCMASLYRRTSRI